MAYRYYTVKIAVLNLLNCKTKHASHTQVHTTMLYGIVFLLHLLLSIYHVFSSFADGHHKLVRWQFVTHAGIDGYSRIIVYMRSSTNNRSSTVLNAFLEGVQRFGVPSRVRSDYGGENMHVARYMLHNRGPDRNSMIVGSSTHNQRIERLWRDYHACVTKLYYRPFYFLESQGMLEHTNGVCLYALQYVYLPRINRAIDYFVQGWNSHGIRTAQHLSPQQLFTQGVLHLQHSGLVALDFMDNVDNSYGVDTNEPTPLEENTGAVRVPENNLHFSDEVLSQLQAGVDPLAESSNHGIELYEQAISILSQ